MALVMRLNPTAVFSHRTAAWLHGFRQSPPAELDVIVPRSVVRLQGAVVHRRMPSATMGVIVVLDYRVGPYRFDLVHEGGRRAETDWDRLPCWELYDDLEWRAGESAAREFGLFEGE